MTVGREPGLYEQGPQQPQQWAAPPPPPRRRRPRGLIAAVVLVIVVIAVGVLAWQARKSDPDSAAVGDCVSRGTGSDIKVVGCTDPKSTYKVVGKVNDRTQVQFNISSGTICKPFAGAKSAFWKGKSGGKGYVLCLAPAR